MTHKFLKPFKTSSCKIYPVNKSLSGQPSVLVSVVWSFVNHRIIMATRKRKCLAVNDKVEIIKDIERGVKNVDVCKKYGISSSSVSTLVKNKDKIFSSFEENVIHAKKIRTCHLTDVDDALLQWFKIQRNAGLPIDGTILKVSSHFRRLENRLFSRFFFEDFC